MSEFLAPKVYLHSFFILGLFVCFSLHRHLWALHTFWSVCKSSFWMKQPNSRYTKWHWTVVNAGFSPVWPFGSTMATHQGSQWCVLVWQVCLPPCQRCHLAFVPLVFVLLPQIQHWLIPVGSVVMHLHEWRARPAISVQVTNQINNASHFILHWRKGLLERAGPEFILSGKLPWAVANALEGTAGASLLSDNLPLSTALPASNRWLEHSSASTQALKHFYKVSGPSLGLESNISHPCLKVQFTSCHPSCLAAVELWCFS